MKISFLTSGHYPYDDRIFHHMAKTLSNANHKVEITSSKVSLQENSGNISVNCFSGDDLPKKIKINTFTKFLNEFNPDIVICSEPLPLLAARKFRKARRGDARIVYDITEWYPSGKNLSKKHGFLKYLTFLRLLVFNFYTSSLSDAFIFGEWYKSKPYRFLFPLKPFCYLTYYPDLEYIGKNEPCLLRGHLTLSYSGRISIEKGFSRFIKVVNRIAGQNPDLRIRVKIIGWYETEDDRTDCEKLILPASENLDISFTGKLDFQRYLAEIRDTDIFIDLRENNFENRHCLPIRLFYYAAIGRPVIFSDLKSIRRDVEIEKFGSLTNPADTDNVAGLVMDYIRKPELYFLHCTNARKAAEELYNWKNIAPGFLRFIDSLSIH
jgi:glycosyltransferase involved in cell wall biosynthesis